MREKKLGPEEIKTRRKMIKAGLAAAGGAGLVALLGKKGLATACPSCAPGCKTCETNHGGAEPEPMQT